LPITSSSLAVQNPALGIQIAHDMWGMAGMRAAPRG